MPPNRKYPSENVEKICWDAWWEYGTLEAAAVGLYRDKGIYNHGTGKPLSRFGIELAAWRWAMKNIDAAIGDFRADAEKHKEVFDEHNFYIRLVRAAKGVYRKSPHLFMKWLEDNKLTEYVIFTT